MNTTHYAANITKIFLISKLNLTKRSKILIFVEIKNIMCIMLFSKKKPKEWTFDSKPVVNWNVRTKAKYDMVTICKLILTEILGIKDIELTVVTNDNQVSKFDTKDFELRAMLLGTPSIKKYTLLLRSNIGAAEVLSIVCHEMVHLNQMHNGWLSLVGYDFIWKNKFYPGSTPYFDRPWEKEAVKEQTDIEKKVKKLYFE